MKHAIGFLTLIAFAGAPAAAARDGSSHLDLYYIPKADLEVTDPALGSGEDDGDGFGIRGLFRSGPQFAITGQYQTTSYDDSDIDVDQLRIGGGFIGATTSGVFVEYIDASIDDSDIDGFGVKGRLASDMSPTVQVYGELGYNMLSDDQEDFTGLEYTLGAALRFASGHGAFLDYRVTNLEGDDSELELEFSDLRVGLRLNFGG